MKKIALALGLSIAVAGCSTSPSTTSTPAVDTAPIVANPEVKVTRTVALKVPDMSCPFACWPKVKETLAAEPGVGTVALADQKDANAIDNPVVYVGVSDDFQSEHAIAALSEKGFKESTEEVK